MRRIELVRTIEAFIGLRRVESTELRGLPQVFKNEQLNLP
jgi:hypothetical protein